MLSVLCGLSCNPGCEYASDLLKIFLPAAYQRLMVHQQQQQKKKGITRNLCKVLFSLESLTFSLIGMPGSRAERKCENHLGGRKRKRKFLFGTKGFILFGLGFFPLGCRAIDENKTGMKMAFWPSRRLQEQYTKITLFLTKRVIE